MPRRHPRRTPGSRGDVMTRGRRSATSRTGDIDLDLCVTGMPSCQWPGWWVRVALAFESGDTDGSVGALRSIVAPTQSRPPDDLEDLLQSLVASYDANGSVPPGGVERAVDLARAHGFL